MYTNVLPTFGVEGLSPQHKVMNIPDAAASLIFDHLYFIARCCQKHFRIVSPIIV